MTEQPEHQLLLVTGPAGAGRSSAINILEDLGYEGIDNLPMHLLPRLLSAPLARPLAIGIDTRTRGFDAAQLLQLLAKPSPPALLFLDCNEENLLRRFSETRRRHPMAPAETPVLGIHREAELLHGLRRRADILIDTSELSPHDLKAEMARLFSFSSAETLAISVQSFSYKRGTPRGVDMILDCRFLQNPHWQPALREFNGKDAPVADFVAADPLFTPFFQQLTDMCDLLLPAYQKEGKAYFAIGFGCSGGKHRSVSIAEKLAKTLAQRGWQVSIRHREIGRRSGDSVQKENP